jgi:predicted nucleic acid-binding protein
MKANKAHDVTRYVFQAGENILIDANVWIFLLPPAAQPAPRFAGSYSAALKNLIAAGARPVVESLILSEYVNRYLRLEYEAFWSRHYRTFKKFRKSGDFSSLATAAIAEAREILRIAAANDTPFSQTDIAAILAETEAGTLDFNDGVLVETCRLRGWKLLTNDGDMSRGGIEVLTSYPPLLYACP